MFATKSLISEIKLDPNLIQLPQGAQVTFDKTALSDTSAGLELKIKDPKEFFKNYQARSHEIKLLGKIKKNWCNRWSGFWFFLWLWNINLQFWNLNLII
ncbi:hypothetical protein [Mycoplasma sp. 'Moose RK']|uniref:hypothetical protein n=1 Tax=Mycoplasma sp. 'Moose RK' TaxID=2780095 RepID=UPI0018C23621|nr:hypothetical protein [Mycoplasma sp. 'Moose RK']MBG0731105.1 hypothetical protein [Mycoplasma sp. 'Moose RK']